MTSSPNPDKSGESAQRTGLDLVALGTVADMMPLLGENRYLVQQGLSALNRSPRLGLCCLMAEAGLSPGQVDTETISFCLAPRLNAAGRLAHARLSYSLLTARSHTEAQKDAATLEAYNRQRQRLTDEVCARAQEMLVSSAAVQWGLPPLIMLGDPSFDPGVVGISASHLSQQFYRPTILFHQGAEVCRGSARSIPEFNVVAALAQCQPWLVRFGGHPQAAGFTALPKDIPQIQQKLVEIAARELAGVDLRPRLTIDAQVRLSDLSGEFLRFLSRMAPYGPGNPPPTFLSRRVAVTEAHPIGGQGKHLRLKLQQDPSTGSPSTESAKRTGRGRVTWQGVAFDLMEQHGLPGGLLDVVYTLGIDSWQGQEFLELRLLDFAPSGTVRLSA